MLKPEKLANGGKEDESGANKFGEEGDGVLEGEEELVERKTRGTTV